MSLRLDVVGVGDRSLLETLVELEGRKVGSEEKEGDWVCVDVDDDDDDEVVVVVDVAIAVGSFMTGLAARRPHRCK